MREYFEAEMRLLHEAAQEFAQAHPEQARMLNLNELRDRDPYIERLLEGMAFLTAHVRQRIEESEAAVSEQLLAHVCPNQLTPYPSTTILAFEPDVYARLARSLRPAWKCFQSRWASTGWNAGSEPRPASRCSRWPWTRCRPKRKPAAIPSSDWASERRAAAAWSNWTWRACRCFCMPTSRWRWPVPGADPGHPSCPCAVPGVLRVPRCGPRVASRQCNRCTWSRKTPCFRIPAAATPVSICCRIISAAATNTCFRIFAASTAWNGPRAAAALTVEIECEAMLPPEHNLVPENIRLHCVPAINLFDAESEPVEVDHRRTEYRLLPDVRYPEEVFVYSVNAVIGRDYGTGKVAEYKPLYGLRGRGKEERHYHAVRRDFGTGLPQTYLAVGGHRQVRKGKPVLRYHRLQRPSAAQAPA